MDKVIETILERALEAPFTEAVVEQLSSAAEPAVAASAAVLPLLVAVHHRLAGGPLLVVVPRDAGRLACDIEQFLPGRAHHLPGGGLSSEWARPQDESAGQRFRASQALSRGMVAVAGAEALMGGVPTALPAPWPLAIAEGYELDLEATLRALVDGGYEREFTVEGWGRFALRGGILDIFPSTAERPVRLELVGDRVESVREFNLVTQRSTGKLTEVEIFPASEPQAGKGKTEGLPPGTLVIAVDRELIEARAAELAGDLGVEQDAPGVLSGLERIAPVDTMGGSAGGPRFPGEAVREFRGDLAGAVGEWNRVGRRGDDVFLLLEGRGQVERALELWDEQGKGRRPVGSVGKLSRGFAVPELRFALYSSSDLLGRRERRRTARRASSGAPVTSYAELEVGGFVVHVDQGIGVYRGLTSREVLGVTREYLLLEYAGNDKLYVPTAQLDKVQRYVGTENPTVHKLRGKEWLQARRKAKRSAEKTARELLQLYMERKSRPGFQFSPDTPWQRELEQSFEYEDTPDQARAAGEVKEDMQAPHAMDRLVCGDVGYGKTEVAVRAAMKCVNDSKQAAVLCPTTVLAKQHLDTFRGRLAPFPVRVEMLSRFLSRAEQDEVVAALRRGEVDVVIGTHRLLQDDIGFRDLGLLVVDEEQKFGVAHKERLRRMARNVDTLTLTATPIPRTLQMSISGVRDISIIDTPPEDRHPIATYVGEFDMELVRRAVHYEATRGGQVFYVHNRVKSINRVAETLRQALPGVSVAVAHGQMDEDDLEQVMLEFAEGLHTVLVCTTIIESGLDLPNVNTLIADRADRLGLAQLYQIRGRVGRAVRRAYAYLFYAHRAVLTDTAVARLSTISEMTPLGSGMRVALRDLEIRGAGNLLGAEQSGQIEAVGFELYCELLRESVELLKGEAPTQAREAVVELPVDAYVPELYVPDQEARVEIYRRLVVAGRAGRVSELAADLEDRFGEPPEPVERLLRLERLKYRAAEAGIESVGMRVRGEELQLTFAEGEERLLEVVPEVVARHKIAPPEGVHQEPGTRTLYVKLRFGANVEDRQNMLLKWLDLIIDDII